MDLVENYHIIQNSFDILFGNFSKEQHSHKKWWNSERNNFVFVGFLLKNVYCQIPKSKQYHEWHPLLFKISTFSLTIQLFAGNSIHVCKFVKKFPLSLFQKSHIFSVMLQSCSFFCWIWTKITLTQMPFGKS